ncbi:mRNA surveillance protein pelota [Sulfuracidifex tepidarius]|uniref:Protein pelota homolog n=1 Tax=Sulfuracidifex tepidarius TaxID=1294262 RepID=A0A510DXE3_9CREN|nr:mRNA surveillance protein pelota [Sulfuracidifex tepidarius]BBG24628.1 Peptide chain release factor subunit 1 [Sulfuracidifex tepidarius]BBG27416.1 Peptide chain release factor subunit 1 [Sulfuracidifex tepidarius]
MRILEFDEKQDSLTVHIDTEDDLWLLYLVLRKDDEVIAKTLRDVSVGDNSRRVPMIITLRVERTEFQEFTNRLRIHGIVLDAPERYSVKGSHHTINLGIGDDLTIVRKWEKYELDKIYNQAERKSKILIAVVDIDEYLIAVPMVQGIKILADRSLPEPEESLTENAQEIAKEIESYSSSLSPDAILIAGPGFFKLEVSKLLEKKYKIYVDDVNSPGRTGLNELLRRDMIDQLIRDYEIAEGRKQMDRINELIAKGSRLATYGKEEVKKAVEMGAVETLVILSELIMKETEEGKQEYQMILEDAAKKGGRVILVPKDSPAYYELRNLGGIACLLRFGID